jgi:hypothetical protein
LWQPCNKFVVELAANLQEICGKLSGNLQQMRGKLVANLRQTWGKLATIMQKFAWNKL